MESIFNSFYSYMYMAVDAIPCNTSSHKVYDKTWYSIYGRYSMYGRHSVQGLGEGNVSLCVCYSDWQVRNQVVLWDRIIRRGDTPSLEIQSSHTKYKFFDEGHGLK